jgi:hypothetical protein
MVGRCLGVGGLVPPSLLHVGHVLEQVLFRLYLLFFARVYVVVDA